MEARLWIEYVDAKTGGNAYYSGLIKERDTLIIDPKVEIEAIPSIGTEMIFIGRSGKGKTKKEFRVHVKVNKIFLSQYENLFKETNNCFTVGVEMRLDRGIIEELNEIWKKGIPKISLSYCLPGACVQYSREVSEIYREANSDKNYSVMVFDLDFDSEPFSSIREISTFSEGSLKFLIKGGERFSFLAKPKLNEKSWRITLRVVAVYSIDTRQRQEERIVFGVEDYDDGSRIGPFDEDDGTIPNKKERIEILRIVTDKLKKLLLKGK